MAACSTKSRSMLSLALTNNSMSKSFHFIPFTWAAVRFTLTTLKSFHPCLSNVKRRQTMLMQRCQQESDHGLDHVTFVSHYIDDNNVTARTCCDISYHVECSWKIWSRDMYYLATSHLYQIALMMSMRNMSWYVVTYRRHILEKSLITLNLIKPSNKRLQNCKYRIFVVLNYIDVIARRVK